MRHKRRVTKLGRSSSHRKAMISNMITSLFLHERIMTTVEKAKEARRFAEKTITFAKKNTLHSRRLALKQVKDKSVLDKLFAQIAPRFAERNGGYTRVIRLGHREGDGAEMAYLELVGRISTEPEKEEKKAKRKAKKKAAKQAESTVEAEGKEEIAEVEKTEAKAEVNAEETPPESDTDTEEEGGTADETEKEEESKTDSEEKK